VLKPTSLRLELSVFPAHQRGTAVGVWRQSARWPGQRPGARRAAGRVELALDLPINLPVTLAALAAGAAVLPRPDGQRARGYGVRGSQPAWRIDGVGTVLVLGAVGQVCTALAEAPGQFGQPREAPLRAAQAMAAFAVGADPAHPARRACRASADLLS
jgi:hypothetical protein